MQKSMMEKLESYRPLDQQKDIKDFVLLIKKVVQLGNPEDIPILLSFFSDDSEHMDVMQWLLTDLEDYPVEKYVPKLLEALPCMLNQSPEWLITIVMRMFNNEYSLEIFKKNISISSKKSMLNLLKLIQIESEKYKSLCSELKDLLEKNNE